MLTFDLVRLRFRILRLMLLILAQRALIRLLRLAIWVGTGRAANA